MKSNPWWGGTGSQSAGAAQTVPRFLSVPDVSELLWIPVSRLPHETLYVGVDIGKVTHVGGFVSTTLLSRYQRFESCPALPFENSREGFRALVDKIGFYVPLTQVYVVVEVTGHYHRALLQYLQ